MASHREMVSLQINADISMGIFVSTSRTQEDCAMSTLGEDTCGEQHTLNQQLGSSPAVAFASPASFFTADSPASFVTARTAYNSPAYVLSTGLSPITMFETIEEEPAPITGPLAKLSTDYKQGLKSQCLILPTHEELNWSGKGQHVTFLPSETPPLQYVSDLGVSLTARVQKVLCRRIALARKTMRCSRTLTVADALLEVTHLQNLRHSHIVQLIGTYLQGRDFNLLMYPVADCHLGTFLQQTSDLAGTEHGWEYFSRQRFLASSFGCLLSAIRYVHESTTKHLDIKPQNILVKQLAKADTFSSSWRLYLADFGLSRSFADQGHSQTDGPTSRGSLRYCAPEAFAYEKRGRAADIFSLGAVFLEILTVYVGRDLDDFTDWRCGVDDDDTYHANLKEVQTWIQDLQVNFIEGQTLLFTIAKMLDADPAARPTAKHLVEVFSSDEVPHRFLIRTYCCSAGPEPYRREDETG